MNKNREIAETIFQAMRDCGFIPYNIEYVDDDSVSYFRIKRLWKHWKFGIWVNSEYLDDNYIESGKNLNRDQFQNVVSLFAQYDTCLDKFKPSSSALCVSYSAYEWDTRQEYPCPWYKIEDMLGMMKRHPFLCYCGFCGKYVGYSSESFICEFVGREMECFVDKTKDKLNLFIWYNWTRIKCYFAKQDKCIESLEIFDYRKTNPGSRGCYLYEVLPVFTEEATREEEIAWVNRWFRRDEYGVYNQWQYVVRLGWLKKVGREREYVYM